MKFLAVLATSLLLCSSEASNAVNLTLLETQIPHHEDNFTELVWMMNSVKNMLIDEPTSYKITWDDPLALLAMETIALCPEKDTGRNGAIFLKSGDIGTLISSISSNKTFSLDQIPTQAVRLNGSIKVEVDIGSRIGCAYNNCSYSYDIVCHFDTRRQARNRLHHRPCNKDAQFPNLCVEEPVNYRDMEKEDFKTVMMEWNEKRRVLAKAFKASGMYELEWSEPVVKLATAMAATCALNCTDFSEFHVHTHPRALDTIVSQWLLKHPEFSADNMYGSTTVEMFNPHHNHFGCAPSNPNECKDYSYICVLGPIWKTLPSEKIYHPTGNLCGECPEHCNDGLCQNFEKEKLEEKPQKETNEDVEKKQAETTSRPSQTTTVTAENSILNDTGKLLALVVSFIAAVILVFLLIFTIATTDFRY